MSAPGLDPAQFSLLFDWFDAEPADDPIEDLAALRGHFAVLARHRSSGSVLQRCIEQFESRVLDICERFKPRLLTAALPLPRELHGGAMQLVEGLLDVAGGFDLILAAALERRLLARRGEQSALGARALQLVNQAFLVSSMSGAVAPAGLWRRAYALAQASGRLDDEAEPGRYGAGHEFKRLVALSALQPESLTAREVAWVFEYVEAVAELASVADEPIQPETSAFWADPTTDGPPTAVVRRPAPAVEGLLHFSAQGVSRRVAEQIDWLETRIAASDQIGAAHQGEWLEAEGAGLPLGLTPAEALSLLRRMRNRWSSPGGRAAARRPHQYTVQVCSGLRAIWDMARLGPDAAKLAEWTVYNESPGGYAIMSVSGVANTLTAGMALALRRDPTRPWSICLVRWIRCENPEQVELGLQVIANGCDAVSIAFTGADVHTTAPALSLPPLPGLRSNPAILTAAGTYASRRFVLVQEGDHLYVAQAHVLSLDMQTASVELFQYEIDSYPL